MIAIDRLGVSLSARPVVADVTLRVDSHGWTNLIGPNGAGKTTLLRAVAGLISHTGRVTVGGRDLRDVSARARAEAVAVVPQSPLLPPDMTVEEYVLLGRTSRLGMFGRPGAADRKAIAGAIERLDLAGLGDRMLAALSGGEQQRVVIARAVAQEAPVLLLDEPTTALDVGRQQEVLDLLGELRSERELTVLGAMHDLTLAGQYAERLALLDEGRLVAHGEPADVLTEALISRHYRARVRVANDHGAPVVMPSRAEAAT